MHKTIAVIAVGTVLATGVFHVSAQAPSAQWKNDHGVGERYEGVGFDRKVSTVGLELISFLAISKPDTRAAIDVSKDEEIVVDFFARTASPYSLSARELELLEYYWMEPKVRRNAAPGPNTFSGIWKTDVLRELKKQGSGVSIGGLGVLVWFGKGDDDVAQVAPAVVRAAGAKPTPVTGAYTATFLSDLLFDKVSFSVRGGCQVSDVSKPFPGGRSVGKKFPLTSFPVQFSIPAGYSGPVMLEITTTRREKTDKSWYCFTHPTQFR